MPDEESSDWDSILEERLTREAARRPTAPLPEGARHAKPPEKAAREPTRQMDLTSVHEQTASRTQFDGTAPFQDVPLIKQLSPEEESQAVEYLRSIPKTRKLVLALVLVLVAALSGAGAFVMGTFRPPPPEVPLGAFRFRVEPAGLEGFSAPPAPKPAKKPAEFDPGVDPLPGF